MTRLQRQRLLAAAATLAVAGVGVTAARAADVVFTDHFSNGNVNDSDTQSNFWTVRPSGNLSNVVEPAGGPLQLTAGGSQFPHGQIASATQAMFNYYHTPIVVQASGINFTSPTNSLDKAILRFVLASRTLTNNDDSEYLCDDAIALRIDSGNTVAAGLKINSPMANTEYDRFQMFNPGNNFGAFLSGPVRGFTFVLSPRWYDITITHDASATDTTQQTQHFAGSLDMFMDQWHDSTDPSPLTGDSAMFFQAQLNNAQNTEQATATLGQVTVSQLKQAWIGGDGNFSDPAHWTDSQYTRTNQDQSQVANIPDYIGANIKFGTTSGPRTITNDIDYTAGALTFDSPQSYTINAGVNTGTIHLATRWLHNEIDVLQGSHTINAPVYLYNDTSVDVAPGSVLTMPIWQPGPELNGAPINVTKTSAGRLDVGNVRFNAATISGGTMRVIANTANNDPNGASLVKSLNIAGTPAAPTAQLDLTNNGMAIDYTGTSPIDSVRQLLKAGSSNTWSGNGITSSSAAAAASSGHPTAIGYAEASQLLGSSGGNFLGQTVDGTAVLMKYAAAGDADLSGKVDLTDFTFLAANFNATGRSWSQGDFNYDGVVDLTDFTFLAGNFNYSLPSADAGGVGALVPEPGAMTLLVTMCAAPLMRRRRTA